MSDVYVDGAQELLESKWEEVVEDVLFDHDDPEWAETSEFREPEEDIRAWAHQIGDALEDSLDDYLGVSLKKMLLE